MPSFLSLCRGGLCDEFGRASSSCMFIFPCSWEKVFRTTQVVVRRMEASSVWISAQHWVLEVSPHGGYLSPFLTPPAASQGIYFSWLSYYIFVFPIFTHLQATQRWPSRQSLLVLTCEFPRGHVPASRTRVWVVGDPRVNFFIILHPPGKCTLDTPSRICTRPFSKALPTT